MLPHFTIEEELNNEDLIEESKEEAIGIYTAVHKDKWVSVNLEAFLGGLMKQETE